MADETNTPEEEYQFSEMESPDAFGAAAKEPPSQQKKAVQRRVLIGIGVIVVVLLVYKLLGVFFGPKTVKKKTVQPVVVTSIKPVRVAVTATQLQVLQQKLQQLEQQTVAHTANMRTIQADLTGIRNTLMTVNSQLTTLASGLDTVNKRLERKKPPVKPVKVRKRRVKPARKRAIRREVYFIQAVIPGRAWLKSEKRSTITVSIGTRLPGYGVITRIDPQRGRVMTSSGRIIRYGPGDL